MLPFREVCYSLVLSIVFMETVSPLSWCVKELNVAFKMQLNFLVMYLAGQLNVLPFRAFHILNPVFNFMIFLLNLFDFIFLYSIVGLFKKKKLFFGRDF